MDFENGVIIKIYKSKVDPILIWGRLRRPHIKMGISSGPMTYTSGWFSAFLDAWASQELMVSVTHSLTQSLSHV